MTGHDVHRIREGVCECDCGLTFVNARPIELWRAVLHHLRETDMAAVAERSS